MRDMQRGLRMNSKRMRKDKRKWYIYTYAKLLLDSQTTKQRDVRFEHFKRVVLHMWQPHGEGEKNVLKSFVKTLDKAFTFLDYLAMWNIPTNTNQIEGYISRFNARLKTMRGLKSPANAELLLNGLHYYLRR